MGGKIGKTLGFFQCDMEVPEFLKANSSNFPPIFKKFLVSQKFTVNLIQTKTGEEKRLFQPRKKLIPSFKQQKGAFIHFMLNWLFFVQKYTALLNTLRGKVSTVF